MDQRMNYESMEAMSKAFQNAAKQLEEVQRSMDKIAKQMEGGALLGQGGQVFVAALNGPLKKKLQEFGQSMNDMSSNIDGAVSKIRDGVASAKSRFA